MIKSTESRHHVHACHKVKKYIASHMTMMGQENTRLMADVAKLKAEKVLANSDCDKKLRNLNQQLEKEKAKNRIRNGNKLI